MPLDIRLRTKSMSGPMRLCSVGDGDVRRRLLSLAVPRRKALSALGFPWKPDTRLFFPFLPRCYLPFFLKQPVSTTDAHVAMTRRHIRRARRFFWRPHNPPVHLRRIGCSGTYGGDQQPSFHLVLEPRQAALLSFFDSSLSTFTRCSW